MCIDSNFEHIKSYAEKKREKYYFDSKIIRRADNKYVLWVDLLGAGHLMTVSIDKTANAIMRLHMAVFNACDDRDGILSVPINDGVFIISKSKKDIIVIIKKIIIDLSCVFLATGNPEDRAMLSCGLAFGPVYLGNELGIGLKSDRIKEIYKDIFNQVAFGSAIIQAYKEERNAAPFGVAIHESARSFSPSEEKPFQETHLRWWRSDSDINFNYPSPSLKDLKKFLKISLIEHLNKLEEKFIYNEISIEKINTLRNRIKSYY